MGPAVVLTPHRLRPRKPRFAIFSCVTSGELLTFLSLPQLYNRANILSERWHWRVSEVTHGNLTGNDGE